MFHPKAPAQPAMVEVTLGKVVRMPPIATADEFARWRAGVEPSVASFVAFMSTQIAAPLDFSAVSLTQLEAWLLARYPLAATLESDGELGEKIAVYVGEVFRRQLGGDWTVLTTESALARYNRRDLRDLVGVPLMNCPPACCPRQLVVETMRKRSGFCLRASFEYFKKRRQREERAAQAAAAAAGAEGLSA
jgi:hypothetical protein